MSPVVACPRLLALLASALVAAQPTVAIVVSRRVDVGAPVVAKVTSALEDALDAEQITGVVGAAEAKRRMAASGVQSAESCENDRVCLIGLLHLLKVDVVIAVDVGHVVDQYVLRISALDPSQPAPLAERATLVKLPKLGAVLPDEARAFARALKPALASLPLAAAPEPAAAVAAPPVIVVPAPAAAPPASARSLGTGAVFALAGASGLTSLAAVIAGSVLKGQLYGSYSPSRPQSSLSLDRAQSLANQANTAFTVSLVAVLLAGVALAAGLALWLLS